jgi:hypothetical protein
MEPDFPAAHSMDTRWFAVDSDGHVAMFSSREAGAVPLLAFSGDETYEVRQRLYKLLPGGDMIHDLAGRVLPSLPTIPLTDVYGIGEVILMFLTSLDPVRPALQGGRAREVRATEGAAVIFRGITSEELDGYKAAPEFRGCVALFYDLVEEGEERERSLAEHGVFEYEHLTENWISGPYGRESLPVRPIHVDQLPPDLRDRVGRLRLKLRFADTTHIQPVELARCASWEQAYLDVTGKHIRPIPGKEDEYASAAGDLTDIGKRLGMEVEPPPDKGA